MTKWLLLRECAAAGMVRFTDKARRVVFYAYQAAVRSGDHEVTPTHLLLGILVIDECLVVRADLPPLPTVRERLSKTQTRRRSSDAVTLSDAARQAISLAAHERDRLGHKHTGTEHLLLGITRGTSNAAQLLRDYSITSERLLQLLVKQRVSISSIAIPISSHASL